jgi:hypothetical protein
MPANNNTIAGMARSYMAAISFQVHRPTQNYSNAPD